MHPLPGPKLPAFVPVTAVAVGLFSMNTVPPPSLSTMSGKEPGVHGIPVLCGSLALVTAWQVVQYTSATSALPV
jgi:hypothetical protein